MSPDASGKVVAEAAGPLRYLRLNKTARLNALDEEMLLEMERLLAAWENEESVSVVVVASKTEKAFCAGADIETLSRMDEASMQSWEMLGNRLLDRIETSPLVSIASIPGHALGGGLTLAAACDFRLCSESAVFGQPEIELGWAPGWGGVARLGRLIGAARTKELCMTGRRLTAREAETLGLVNRVVPAADLEGETSKLASRLAGQSAGALRAIKALAGDILSPRGPAAHRLDALVNASLLHDERGQAAIARFLTKRRS